MDDHLIDEQHRLEHVVSRRTLLRGAIAGGMAFGGFGNLFAAENAKRAAQQQKHVILLWMSGGPSQFETWDPKPGMPTGGPHLSIPTSVPGLHIDEFMPKLARLSKVRRQKKRLPDEIYDVTGWSLPLIYDVEAYSVHEKSSVSSRLDRG